MMRSIVFLLIFFAGFPAHAQIIDLFDGQDSMPEKKLSLEIEGSSVSGSNESSGQAGSPIILRFERRDSSIMVPATIRGKEVYFLFDTGATYTTLTGSFARSVGAFPPKDGPTAVMQTANGSRVAAFGLIDRLVLGGRPHTGVTYSVCDACPSGTYKGKPVVGLLGRNVIGRYRYEIDEGNGKIVMSPASHYHERMRDIEHWLNMDSPDVKPIGRGRVLVTFAIRNRAPKSVSDLHVNFQCDGGKSISLGRVTVPAQGKKQFRKELTQNECVGARVQFDNGHW